MALEQQDVLAFRGLLAFTFVLFVRPQDSLPLLDAMHLGDLTALFSLAALVVARIRRGLPAVTVSRELGWVAGFGAVMILTAPLSIWPGGAVSMFIDLYSKVILIFALMVHTITTRARFNRLLSLVVAGTAYIAIRAVIDYARGVNLIEDGRVTGAVGGLFGNPNDLALNMVAFLPLGLALMQDRGAAPGCSPCGFDWRTGDGTGDHLQQESRRSDRTGGDAARLPLPDAPHSARRDGRRDSGLPGDHSRAAVIVHRAHGQYLRLRTRYDWLARGAQATAA